MTYSNARASRDEGSNAVGGDLLEMAVEAQGGRSAWDGVSELTVKARCGAREPVP